jgi:hypothetical protein
LPKESPKSIFIREVLEKEVRLSYWDRVVKTLPPEFVNFMPEKPNPYLKYNQGNNINIINSYIYNMFYQQKMHMLMKKPT